MPTKSALKRDQARWRREFDIPAGITFLNHASFGPVPRRGRKAVEQLLRRQGRFQGDPDVDAETFELLDASRRMFARITGADPRRVAFAPNASYGLSAVLHGLGLQKNDRILLPRNEFPAAVYPVRTIAERNDVRMVAIPCPTGSIDLDAMQSELKRGAAVFVTSWVQYFNGFRNDLATLSRLCHEHGCFLLVDVSQGAGAVPLNMRRDGVDAISCGAQKWLLGQTGAGFFAISPSPVRAVTPLYTGWLGYDWGYTWGDLQRWDRPPLPDGRFWEVGTYPFYSVRLAHAGLSILSEYGIKNAYERLQYLNARLIQGLAASRYRPVVFPDRRNRSGILTVAGPKTDFLQMRLESKRIHVSLREGNIRVSPHFYNSEKEIDRLVKSVIEFERQHLRK